MRVGVLWLQVDAEVRVERAQVVPQVLIKNFLGLNSPGDNTCTKNHFGCVSVRHMDVFIRMRQKQKNRSMRALSKTANFPAMMNKWLCICTRTERSLVLESSRKRNSKCVHVPAAMPLDLGVENEKLQYLSYSFHPSGMSVSFIHFASSSQRKRD